VGLWVTYIMATVPTPLSLGQGQVQTTPDRTPLQSPDINAVTAPGRIQAEQLSNLGGAIAQTSSNIQLAVDKVKSREDTIDRARKITQFNKEAEKILQTAKDTTDLSLPEAIQDLNTQLRAKQNELLSDHGGSGDSNATLAAQLEVARSGFASLGAQENVTRQKAIVNNILEERMGGITAQALREPGGLEKYFKEWDSVVADMADGLDPEEEIAHLEAGRSAIVLSAIDAFIARGNYLEAKKLINENPFVMKALDPAQQRQVMTEIATGLKAQDALNNAGNLKVQEAEQILGRKLNGPERVKLAGLANTGTQTIAGKIADIEKAIGRELTREQKEVLAGLRSKPTAGGGELVTEAGKAWSDVDRAKDRWGEGSTQHNALVEVAKALQSGEDISVSDEGGLRKEFTKLAQPYVLVRDAYDKIEVSAKNSTPAGDISLIIAYMKLLDPGSTVREGEFATAEQAGNVGQRIYSMYVKLVTSKGRLSPEQRSDFVQRSKALMQGYQKSHEHLEVVFRKLAKSMGANPDHVVIDFVGDRDRINQLLPEDGPVDDVIPIEPTEIDLKGEPIVSQPRSVADENGRSESQPAKVKRDPNAKIDFDNMDAAALGQIDIKGLSKADKNALRKRLKELGL